MGCGLHIFISETNSKDHKKTTAHVRAIWSANPVLLRLIKPTVSGDMYSLWSSSLSHLSLKIFFICFRTWKTEEVGSTVHTVPRAELLYLGASGNIHLNYPRLQGFMGGSISPDGNCGPGFEGPVLRQQRQRGSKHSLLTGVH